MGSKGCQRMQKTHAKVKLVLVGNAFALAHFFAIIGNRLKVGNLWAETLS